jgi:hypothetical protein
METKKSLCDFSVPKMQSHFGISELEKILEKSWAKDTSAYPEWTKENPSYGQCVSTSLIVNNYFGGTIIWALVTLEGGTKISHFFNKINEKEIDLTRKQFPANTKIPNGKERKNNFSSAREYLLSSYRAMERYKLLKQRVEDYKNSNL